MVFATNPSWLLLVITLPTTNATVRMRVWRALKALGCMALRDGAYLLPQGADREQDLLGIAEECRREQGAAWLVGAEPRGPIDAQAWRDLFDRSSDYAELRQAWKVAHRDLGKLAPAELGRLKRRLQREFDAVRAIDFFPGDARLEAEAALGEFMRRVEALLSPDEPHGAKGQVARLDPADYRGRTWATRRKLWVDRVASAWLIRRFIDPDATFVWLARPADCPEKALGFDFDGAAFTHVGDRVTFETLMASFSLGEDASLVRIAGIVHQLDVGGDPVPEAAGFEAVMTGARSRLEDDDALLDEMSRVLDSLYANFQKARA